MNLKAMCPKKISISYYKSLKTPSHKTRIVELKANQRKEQLLDA